MQLMLFAAHGAYSHAAKHFLAARMRMCGRWCSVCACSSAAVRTLVAICACMLPVLLNDCCACHCGKYRGLEHKVTDALKEAINEAKLGTEYGLPVLSEIVAAFMAEAENLTSLALTH